ncbi:MAG TPA: patatin-like phospholipase family protein, partial [Steroidobacteraceae bacterium]|nr:patatin-like phospholipase family protein [Steroidobacteraceae bacterium]
MCIAGLSGTRRAEARSTRGCRARNSYAIVTTALACALIAFPLPLTASTEVAPAAVGATLPTMTSPRPRIGLALGGGGAKGAAHVGVLTMLEDMRIPIDCIVGTSMGALVGGTYAAGMTAA